MAHLALARKCKCSLGDRFSVFVRDREQKQKAHSATSGEAAMDLVSYVEFQVRGAPRS